MAEESLAAFFAANINNTQTVIVFLESIEHAGIMALSFASTDLNKVGEWTFFTKKIKQTEVDSEKPVV